MTSNANSNRYSRDHLCTAVFVDVDSNSLTVDSTSFLKTQIFNIPFAMLLCSYCYRLFDNFTMYQINVILACVIYITGEIHIDRIQPSHGTPLATEEMRRFQNYIQYATKCVYRMVYGRVLEYKHTVPSYTKVCGIDYEYGRLSPPIHTLAKQY